MIKDNICPTWAEDYEVPWRKFPQRDLMALLQKGLRPRPKARRGMIRIIVDDIARITVKPGKKSLTKVAQKIANKYPNSFQDEIEGNIVGTGYDSILKQLLLRFENVNRKSNERSLKRKRDDDPVTDEEVTKRSKVHDSYGCINFLPADYPAGESEETQKEKKNVLKEKYLFSVSEDVEELMKETYTLQRKEVVENYDSMKNLQNEWPFLFEPCGMFKHFEMLTGIKIREKIEQSLVKNSETILKWMQGEQNKNIRKIHDQLLESKIILNNKTPEIPAIISSVISHFKENEKSVIQVVKVCSEYDFHLFMHFRFTENIGSLVENSG